MEIIEYDIKQLCEFMEYEFRRLLNLELDQFKINNRWTTVDQIKVDWNFLMEVVEKIENLPRRNFATHPQYRLSTFRCLDCEWRGYVQDMTSTEFIVETHMFDSKLDATLNLVLRFIEYYNKNK